MHKLILKSTAFSDGDVEYQPGQLPIVMGRSKRADLTIQDDLLSRRHSEIRLSSDGEFLICDLDSTNLTIVNESDVSRHVLKSGDRILLGETEIYVEIERSVEDFNERSTAEITLLPDDASSHE